MFSRILNFFVQENFFPLFISLKKFSKIKNQVIVFYIHQSSSQEGKVFLKNVKKKLAWIIKPKKIHSFQTQYKAVKWFQDNNFELKKIVIIGFQKDCKYLYRIIKSKNNKVYFLKI